jgi:hypothetical protein
LVKAVAIFVIIPDSPDGVNVLATGRWFSGVFVISYWSGGVDAVIGDEGFGIGEVGRDAGDVD